jgi:hypothetical protein
VHGAGGKRGERSVMRLLLAEIFGGFDMISKAHEERLRKASMDVADFVRSD